MTNRSLIGLKVLVCLAVQQASGGIIAVGPISGMEATGSQGMITSINGMPVGSLILGTTTFANPPTHSQYPPQAADNFNLNSIGSADNQPWWQVMFDRPVSTVFMIENNGNDSGVVQGLDSGGTAIGSAVSFGTGVYLKTPYLTQNNQAASGMMISTDSPIWGVRMTPPGSQVMGFDPVSVSAVPDAVPAGASQPVPHHSATGLKACMVAQLSWTKPDPWQPGDTVTCSVFLGTQPDALVELPDDDNTDSRVAVSLEDGMTWYWRVDCDDPVTGLVQGAVWSFDTIWSLPDLAADLDADRVVGLADLAILTADWLASCSWADIAPAPLGDGVVNMADLAALAAAWGRDATKDLTVAFNGVIADTYRSTQLNWKHGTVQQEDKTRGFGLALPYNYDPQAETRYPLVLYLHGAGARGSQITSVLQRQTPREFVWYGQTGTAYAAFVVAPQVPANELWADSPWADGPYVQTEATYTDTMRLTDGLLAFLMDAGNNAALAAFSLDARDIDAQRIYVVGDSMGAYGTWDIIARHPGAFAAAIAAAGSGPKNRLAEISHTPFWAIHGVADSTVPNALPSPGDLDGAGSLGMLALLDPTFNNTASTAIVRLDDYTRSDDDPVVGDRLIYTQFPSNYGHATVATEWTTLVSGVKEWLFAHQLGDL